MSDPPSQDPPPPETPSPSATTPAKRGALARLGRVLLFVLRAIGWTATALACLVVSIALHSLTGKTRSVARQLIQTLASNALAGDLEIGRIERMDTDRIVARDIVLRDPQGRAVIRADTLTIWPSYRALLRGQVHVLGARLEHGEVELYVSGQDGDNVSIAEAFQAANPGPDTGGPASPIPIVLDGLHLVDVQIRGDVPGYEDMRFEDVEAFGRIVIDETVDFHVYHLEGRMLGPYPGETRIEHALLEFDTDWREGLGAYARVSRGDDRVRARIYLQRPDAPDPTLPGPQDTPMHMGLDVHVDQLALETLAEMGIPGTERLAGTVRGDARLLGPVEDLRFSAYATHDAGPISIEGRIAREQDLVVEAETYDFDLQRLVPAAPPLSVGGRVHLDLARDPTSPQRARFQITARPLEVAQIFVPAFEAHGAIEADAVVVDRIEAPHLDGVVEGHGRVGFDGSMDVHAIIDVRDLGGDPNVGRLAPGLHSGALAGTLDLEAGPGGEDLALTTQLRAHDLRYGPVRARRLAVRGRARGALSRPVVRLDVQGDEVAISGRRFGHVDAQIDGGPGRYDVTWSSRGPDVRQLDVAAQARLDDGALVVSAPQITADLGLGPMRGAIGSVRVGDGVVHIDDAQLSGEGQRIAAEGVLRTGAGPSSLEVDIEGLDLERLGGLLGGQVASLRGVAQGHLELQGPLRDPDVVLRGRIEDLSWDRVRNADVNVALSYSAGTLTTDVQGDFGTRGALGAEGPIRVPFAALTDPARFAREAEFDLHVYAGHLNLAFVMPFLGEQLQSLGITGRIGGDVSIAGTLDEPRIDPGVIIFDRLTMPGWSEVRVKAHVSMVGDHLEIDRLWIADTTGELAMAEARIPLSLDHPPTDLPSFLRSLANQPWSLGARLSPRLLEGWPRPLQPRMPPGVMGSFALTAAGGDGEPARADLSGTLEWVAAPIEDACARSLRPMVQARGALRDGAVQVDLSGFTGERMVAFGRLEAEAPVDSWMREGTYAMPRPDLLVQLLDLPLEGVPWTCARASGSTTAEIVVHDVLGNAPSLEARLEIAELRLLHGGEEQRGGTQPYHVLAAASIAAPDAGGETEAQACAIFAAEGRLITPFAECSTTQLPEDTEVVVRGAIPLHFAEGAALPAVLLDRDLDLAMLMSDAHLEPLLALIPQVAESDVIADGRLIARGPWETLDLGGGVALRDGRVRVVPLGQHLTDVHGVLRFGDARVEIPEGDPLVARDGEGSLRIHGEIGLRGLVPTFAYLSVDPDQFPVRREGAVLATVTGHGDTRVTIEADGLEGTVTTQQLTVRLPEQMAGSVQSLDDHPDIVVVGTVAPELLRDTRPGYPVHLFVDANDPFWVRRNDFAVQVSAELDVRYLDPDLFIGGVANLSRGYFEVFGKRFEVQRGSLTFGGTEELDPLVDLVAVYELPGGGGANITVAASGQLSNLSIEFSSTETNDQGEIIALLVSGRSNLGADDPSSAAASTEATAQATRVVAGIAAGILTLGLREQFGDAFPLIAIETGANLGDTRIRAGFNAEAIIPDSLRDVVLGAYVEGFVTTRGGDSAGTSGGVGGGVSIELQFPFDLVGSGTYVPPTSWGIDLVWEP